VPPAIVGVLFLGDTTRHGMTGVAACGFVLAVASAVALARFGEAGEEPVPEPAERSTGDLSRATTPV
jgi:hypothetical protein